MQIVLAANSLYFSTLFCSQLNETSGEIVYFGEESQDETRNGEIIEARKIYKSLSEWS